MTISPLVPAKLVSRIDASGDCWLWTGAVNTAGYGHVRYDGKVQRAHRLVYRLCVGEIPAGLTLDHLCRVRNCVNPQHLEPVTDRVNVLRGVGPSAANARKTRCYRGHGLSGGNLIIEPSGKRKCRTCRDAANDLRVVTPGAPCSCGQPASSMNSRFCDDCRKASRLKPINHGTEGGARTHWRRGERPCTSCSKAKYAASLARKLAVAS